MFKKLDLYLLRIFLGPFLFIFSVLFFIFIVQFAWQELDKFMGKGLSLFQILKLLFYLGVTVIQLVLPLTILLASIMTYGQLGESYELTAIKASGISLFRAMMPNLILVILMAIGLFYFSDRIIPSFQYKAKNMLFNIANTKPALNFEEGKFMNDIPNYAIKINSIDGENSDQFTDVIIHKMVPQSEDQQTIIAQNGTLQPTNDKNYLKFELYNGYIYTDEMYNKTIEERTRQQNAIVAYDTMIRLFDISDLINQGIDKQSVTNNYKFFNYTEINNKLDTLHNIFHKSHTDYAVNEVVNLVNNKMEMDSLNLTEFKYDPPITFDDLDSLQKVNVARAALNQLNIAKDQNQNNTNVVNSDIKFANKIVMFQQNILTYSFTCILFFLIGASLGSIIRKGGLGMPVVVAIIIFVIFFILYTLFYQSSKNDMLDPYWASWLPNIIMLPVAIIFTIKAINDSQIFDVNKYREPFLKIYAKFAPSKKVEHQRYQ